MQTLPTISIFSVSVLGLLACATTPAGPPDPPTGPTGDVDLEIRHSGAAATGSSFQSTGTWPSALTPCGYGWTSQPQTVAIGEGTGKIRLVQRRTPMTDAGGASTVTIDLSFDASG